MTTTEKTLDLLAYFSIARQEIGLTEFSRLAGRNKATTYRYLQSLENAGFVEKNPLTRRFRLGPAVLQLAQLREETVPRKEGAAEALKQLAELTGETAHVSVLSGMTLYSLDANESPEHVIRATADVQTLPLHATAAGICALAFGPKPLTNFAKQNMCRFTSSTAVTEQQLDDEIKQAKSIGFGHSDGGFVDDICGLAAPIYDHTGLLTGTVSVASVAMRFTPDSKHNIMQGLMTASREISQNWGGVVPDEIEACWAGALTQKR